MYAQELQEKLNGKKLNKNHAKLHQSENAIAMIVINRTICC